MPKTYLIDSLGFKPKGLQGEWTTEGYVVGKKALRSWLKKRIEKLFPGCTAEDINLDTDPINFTVDSSRKYVITVIKPLK